MKWFKTSTYGLQSARWKDVEGNEDFRNPFALLQWQTISNENDDIWENLYIPKAKVLERPYKLSEYGSVCTVHMSVDGSRAGRGKLRVYLYV
jgi:hypothetical protein